MHINSTTNLRQFFCKDTLSMSLKTW